MSITGAQLLYRGLEQLYLDVVKDRLYCDAPDSLSRRAAQTVIAEILVGLIRLVAPILVHTAEEAWEHLPDELKDGPSVHFSTWPAVEKDILDARDEEKWAEFLAIRREVAKALEQARMEKAIGSSNDAGVTLYPDAELHHVLSQFDTADLEALFIVSRLRLPIRRLQLRKEFGLAMTAGSGTCPGAEGRKCARCWRYSSFVGTAVDHPSLCERCYGSYAACYCQQLAGSEENLGVWAAPTSRWVLVGAVCFSCQRWWTPQGDFPSAGKAKDCNAGQ